MKLSSLVKIIETQEEIIAMQTKAVEELFKLLTNYMSLEELEQTQAAETMQIIKEKEDEGGKHALRFSN